MEGVIHIDKLREYKHLVGFALHEIDMFGSCFEWIHLSHGVERLLKVYLLNEKIGIMRANEECK